MANYQGARVKLTNAQLNKLKSAAKSKTWTILKGSKKNFQDEELSHKLFLPTRQVTKMMIQSVGFLCNTLVNLGKKVITDHAIPIARGNLPWLRNNLVSSAVNKFKEK